MMYSGNLRTISIMALVAIDLSAAFGTVDHTILLNTLSAKYGITKQALKWFNSYLSDRSFNVVIDNKYSKPHDLEVRIPQGSCAGVKHLQPLLLDTT